MLQPTRFLLRSLATGSFATRCLGISAVLLLHVPVSAQSTKLNLPLPFDPLGSNFVVSGSPVGPEGRHILYRARESKDHRPEIRLVQPEIGEKARHLSRGIPAAEDILGWYSHAEAILIITREAAKIDPWETEYVRRYYEADPRGIEPARLVAEFDLWDDTDITPDGRHHVVRTLGLNGAEYFSLRIGGDYELVPLTAVLPGAARIFLSNERLFYISSGTQSTPGGIFSVRLDGEDHVRVGPIPAPYNGLGPG